MLNSVFFPLLFGLFHPVFGGEAGTYLNTNAWEAQKITAGIIAVDPARLSTEAERIEWVNARLAAIALARLQGKEGEALKLFAGCGSVCGKYAEQAEWSGITAWGCAKNRDAGPCLQKTKAQKPPH